MVWQQQQAHKQPDYKQLRIQQPGYGGLNIKDLDFMLRPQESPKMMNMMVKDGVFKKRYGQERLEYKAWTIADELTWGEHRPVMFEFHEILYVMYTQQISEHRYDFFIDKYDGETVTNVFHLDGTDVMNGTMIYKSDPATTDDFYKEADYVTGYSTFNTGIFFMSNSSLYCMATYPGYDGHSFNGNFFRFYVFARLNKDTGMFEMQSLNDEKQVYVPTVAINCKPDATYFDVDGMDEFNIINPKVTIEYNGDGSSKTYKVPDIFKNDHIGYVTKVEVNNQVTTAYTATFGQVVFNSAPSTGQNNVAITISTTTDVSSVSFTNYSYAAFAAEIFGAQFCTTFGGANNSRMFVSGASERYLYSEVNDPSYFPAINYGVAGYDGERIMGFGHHYKDLVVFKANSIYTLKYQYGADSNGDMQGLIYSQPVNLDIGCDAPNTIRKISNRLTWLSTKYGVCTLVSTVLEDERNVCVVSRNIEQGERVTGLMDEANPYSFAIDYDGKYILFNNQTSIPPTQAHSGNEYIECYPKTTNVYVWDYSIAPFFLSEKQSVEDSARNTSWYVWDNFYAIAVKRFKKELVTLDYNFKYENGQPHYGISLNKLIDDENDFGESINAYYQTPMLDFNEYGYLKTVRKVFIQCRGGITYNTTVKYLTDEDEDGEEEAENLVSTGTVLWDDFTWNGFAWGETPYANTFARKCSLKKIELAGILFSNNIVNNDMPINGIQMTYTLVKEIK